MITKDKASRKTVFYNHKTVFYNHKTVFYNYKAAFCIAFLTIMAFILWLAPSETFAKSTTQTVYVLSRITRTDSDGKVLQKFAYTDEGLLKSINYNQGAEITKFSYNKKHQFKKMTYKSVYEGKYSCTYRYDSKGRLVSIYSGDSEIDIKYYLDDKAARYTVSNGSYLSYSMRICRFAYDAKGDLYAIRRRSYSEYMEDPAEVYDLESTKFFFDQKGNLTMWGGYSNKNVYKKKRLSKRTVSGNGLTWTETYKYKKLTVDKTLADQIKAQQWALINENLNLALGTYSNVLITGQ